MMVGRWLRGLSVVLVAALMVWGLQGCKGEEESPLDAVTGAAEEVQDAAQEAAEELDE